MTVVSRLNGSRVRARLIASLVQSTGADNSTPAAIAQRAGADSSHRAIPSAVASDCQGNRRARNTRRDADDSGGVHRPLRAVHSTPRPCPCIVHYMTESIANNADRPDRTSGHLLDGRVHYAQPRQGFRSGIEPVLLAASVPARPGERVLEGGTGAGATLLCLAARVPGLQAMGIERDAGLVSLARQNAAANLWPGLGFIEADMAVLPDIGTFDHACANPPYHPAGGTPSPDPARDTAKRGRAGVLQVWATVTRDAPPAARDAHLHPAGHPAAGLHRRVRRRRLSRDRDAAVMEAGRMPGKARAGARREGRQDTIPRPARPRTA